MRFSIKALTTAVTVALINLAFAAPTAPSESALGKRDFAPGWCTFHLTLGVPDHWDFNVKHQPYTVAVPQLYDGNRTLIGSLPATNATLPVDMTSPLPSVLVITSEWDHAKYIQFAYGSEFWKSSDANHCKVGAYDKPTGSGTLDMDCGFTC